MVILRGYVVVPNSVSSLTRVQPNILVDATGCARITDYCLAAVTQNLNSINSASDDHGHTARWTAPEILNEEGSYSKEADVFSFAMVAVEVRQNELVVSDFGLLQSHHHRYSPGPPRSMMPYLQRQCRQ